MPGVSTEWMRRYATSSLRSLRTQANRKRVQQLARPGARNRALFFRPATALVACAAVSLLPLPAHAQQQSAHALVQEIVNHELEADANDHSRWMYRDAETVSGKSTVKLVVQTAEGDLSKTIEINGRPLTPQQQMADEQTMHQFVTNPAIRQKQKRGQQQDNQKATSLTKMLPDAFLWSEVSSSEEETTLAFKPNPKFSPPTREARVFAAMEGTMVVNTKQKRIKSLKGKLISNVQFGWFGVLGKLEKGGTFNVERRNISGSEWQITETHVHIQGHALLFKSISEQQDEETSNFVPTPAGISLAEAEKMLNDGTVARMLGLDKPHP